MAIPFSVDATDDAFFVSDPLNARILRIAKTSAGCSGLGGFGAVELGLLVALAAFFASRRRRDGRLV